MPVLDLLIFVGLLVSAITMVVIGGSLQLSFQHRLEVWAEAHPREERVRGKKR